jgi:hypothetical protein
LRTRGGIRVLVAAALAGAALLSVPAGASAQGATLDGAPLNVFADGLGAIQVRQDGVAAGLFYDPEVDPGHAGLEIVEGGNYYPLEDGFTNAPGRVNAEPLTIAQSGATRAMHTAYTIGPNLRVSEDVTYTDGTPSIGIHYGIQNVSGAPTTVRAGALADLYVGSNDNGSGAIAPTAPRFVGGRDDATGLVYGLQEVTPWSAYQEGDFELVFDNFSAGGLNNTVDPEAPDNGVGVQFELGTLAPGEVRGIDVRWLLASPPPPGTTSPGGDGTTPTTPVGPGVAELATLPPPVAGKRFNVSIRRGKVFVKIPPSKKFVELKDARQIPVGATFDTRKGRINLQMAGAGGALELAWFYDGVFKVRQSKGSKPRTSLKMVESIRCGKARKATAAAKRKKKKSRKLWGEGKGNFRTTGRFSSATVRGTKWLVTDRCGSTVTRVTEGSVKVRDFAKHKTVVVRAGKKYVARKRKPK